MNCSKCQSTDHVKNGKVKGRQRYKCSKCGFNYTVGKKSTAKHPWQKRMGLMMYLEGLGFNSIARLLGVSHVAVLKWVKKYGQQLEGIKNGKPVEVMELDGVHHYTGAKKNTVGSGLQLMERENSTLISLLGTGAQKRGANFGNGRKT